MKIIFYLRSLLMSFVFIGLTLIVSIISLANNIIWGSRKLDDKIVFAWAKITCFLFNIKINIHHIENRPSEGTVFLFNHSSYLDIFLLLVAIPGLRFGAKIELFKIPIFGAAITRAGTLPIARGNREEVFKVYEKARSRLQEDKEKFALSPEGGRFYGKNLGPFKAGPFVFAISSGAIISPVVMKGVYEALPKSTLLTNKDRWKREIDIYFLEPVDTKGFSVDQRQDLQKIVYERMNSEWIKT